MKRLARLASLFVLLVCSCKAESPDVINPDSMGLDAGGAYADFVTAYTEGGVPMSCTENIPVCGAMSDCGPSEILDAPDGVGYAIPALGSIEVAFLCNLIVERGSPNGTRTDDFLIHTLGGVGGATVEVSFDGAAWTTMDNLVTTAPSQGFDLDYEDLEVARFVRITNAGNVPLTVDALEALR